MLVKIYESLWILFALAGASTFATGNFTMRTAVVFGFIACGLTFMGMLCVLPTMTSHPEASPTSEPEIAPSPARQEAPARGFRILKSA